MFASTAKLSCFQRSDYLKKDELNGVGGGKGFVARRLLRLYTGLEVGGCALLSKFPPLLDRADFATSHRSGELPLNVSKILPEVYIAETPRQVRSARLPCVYSTPKNFSPERDHLGSLQAGGTGKLGTWLRIYGEAIWEDGSPL
jgi:hypothetical protein